MRSVGIFATFVVFMIVGVIVYGWSLMKLWGWFIAPLFQITPLTIFQAIGVSIIIRLLTYHIDNPQQRELSWSERLGQLIGATILVPLFAVLYGWIITWFLP